MPFKSEKQRKYMNAAAAKGEIKQSVVDEFNKASKGMNFKKYAGGSINQDEEDEKKKSAYEKLRKIMGIK